ncbi:esterase/lipase family protein [Amphritea sp. HPY]|uniref:esterase/lipase family protein n=1 Tax=Amphritea sp. HPY TaxID=3421652 RepID=UPI003D7EA112
MAFNYYLPVTLSDGKDTQAYWSKNPSGHALIFVHGFAGNSVATWQSFPIMLQALDECEGCDLIFYGYDSKHTRSRDSAIDVRDFLQKLSTNPLSVINSSLPPEDARRNAFAYSRITVVAHSLGAIVTREALRQGYSNQAKWAPMTNLVLFAPAHSGANIIELFKSSILFPCAMLVSTAQLLGWYIVLQDLEPNCRTLNDLLNMTNFAISNSNAATLVAKKVLVAGNDRVVDPALFPNDPPPRRIPGTNHQNICKPNQVNVQPIWEVIDVI